MAKKDKDRKKDKKPEPFDFPKILFVTRSDARDEYPTNEGISFEGALSHSEVSDNLGVGDIRRVAKYQLVEEGVISSRPVYDRTRDYPEDEEM